MYSSGVQVCGFALALCIVLCSATIFDSNSLVTVDVGPNACTALAFRTDDRLSYDATVQAMATGKTCNRSDIWISRMYVQDACIALRDNQLGWSSYKSMVCLSVDDDSAKTCGNVFNNAPGSALISMDNLTLPQQIDSGDVCANRPAAFFFVRNACDEPATISFQMNTRPYRGELCVSVAKKRLNTVAIIVIVLSALLAVFLISILVFCCCRCCFCR
eukprot:jgi/Botrbrau1/14846/Bobra.0278s0016.1